jgi:hypothetical protein
MRRALFSCLAAVCLAGSLGAAAARGDAVYHSSHYSLEPIGGAPLRSGFVENIHADGPNVFAHEQYVVNGAQPSTTYQVVIEVFPGDTGCASTPLVIPTAELTTNAAGNGSAHHVFTPADAAGLRGTTDGAIWLLEVAGTPVYATGCQTIRLD